MTSQYDPSQYPASVANPLGPRVHAWNDLPYNSGSRYHGLLLSRPYWSGNDGSTWTTNPVLLGENERDVSGLGAAEFPGSWPRVLAPSAVAGAIAGALYAVVTKEKIPSRIVVGAGIGVLGAIAVVAYDVLQPEG